MKKLKAMGYDIVLRSAGSHSPIDIMAIDGRNKRIRFIQCKPASMSAKKKDETFKAHEWLDEFEALCTFEII